MLICERLRASILGRDRFSRQVYVASKTGDPYNGALSDSWLLVLVGIFQLVTGQILFAIVLFVAAALVGPGGYSIFKGRRTRRV